MVENIIEIPLEAPKKLTVKLGKETYQVRPIKASLGIALSQRFKNADNDPEKLIQSLDTVVKTIFGSEQAKKIQKRLDSGDDLLDFPHIMAVVQKLVEASTGNPTM